MVDYRIGERGQEAAAPNYAMAGVQPEVLPVPNYENIQRTEFDIDGNKVVVAEINVNLLLPAVVKAVGGEVRFPLEMVQGETDSGGVVSVDFDDATNEIVVKRIEGSIDADTGKFSEFEENKLGVNEQSN